MCYYNGTKVTRSEFIRLKQLEKLVADYDFLNNPVYNGLDYPKMPMMRKIGTNDVELVIGEWGFLPKQVQTDEEARNFRANFKTLNATVENLFINKNGYESVFAESAMTRRCLIPTTHFFEWRHIYKRGVNGKVLKSTEAFPYLIRVKESEINYFAGVWNPNSKRGPTKAILTTEANFLMSQVHNLKKRMPTILTEDLAWEWLFNNKLSRGDIQRIGAFQYDSNKMECYTVDKDFINSSDPMKEVFYEGLPPLGEDIKNSPQLGLF